MSEIQGDFGTDSHAGFPILSGYSRNRESEPSLKDPSFGVNWITKTGGPVDWFRFTCEPGY